MKSNRGKEGKGCCNGFLGPLMLTDDGAAERLQVRQIVPWAGVTITGIVTSVHAFMSFLFLYDNLFWEHSIAANRVTYYFVFFGPVPYVLCWIFGFRLALASCSVCRTQVFFQMGLFSTFFFKLHLASYFLSSPFLGPLAHVASMVVCCARTWRVSVDHICTLADDDHNPYNCTSTLCYEYHLSAYT